MKKEIPIGFLVRFIVVGLFVLATFFAVWSIFDMQMYYAAVGLAALSIVSTPFLFIRSYDLFSPWTVVWGTIAALTTPQAICMSFDWPNADSIDKMMLLGGHPSDFFFGGGMLLCGLAAMTFGYFGLRRKEPSRFPFRRTYRPGKVWLFLPLVAVVSVASTFLFVRYTGGLESGRLSDKRTNLETLDVSGSDTMQYGHLREVAKLGSVVFLVLNGYVLTRYKRLTVFHLALIGVSFLAAIALPFYASSRYQVSLVLINALGTSYYLGRGNFALRLAITGGLVLMVFVVMSSLRAKDTSDAVSSSDMTEVIEKLILNRNGPGLSKTALIINHIPDPLGYEYGATFAEWLIAPIPRALYIDKPIIGRGNMIGTTIYDTKLSGIPPGLVAELYWNFHIPGVLIGMLLFGLFLERLYSLFRNMIAPPGVKVPIYLFTVIPIGFSVLGNSLGFGTMMQLVDFVAIAPVVWLCTGSVEPRQSDDD